MQNDRAHSLEIAVIFLCPVTTLPQCDITLYRNRGQHFSPGTQIDYCYNAAIVCHMCHFQQLRNKTILPNTSVAIQEKECIQTGLYRKRQLQEAC